MGEDQAAQWEHRCRLLEDRLGKTVAERDRLRAVVDAALDVVRSMTDSACDADVLRVADLYGILAPPQLDVSPAMGGCCPDCGNPERYCDCPDRSADMGRGVDADPPAGSGWVKPCEGSGIQVNGPPDLATGPCHICGQIVATVDDLGTAMAHWPNRTPAMGGDDG